MSAITFSTATRFFRRTELGRKNVPVVPANPAVSASGERNPSAFFKAAGCGDLRVLTASLDNDPALVTAEHTVGGTALHFAVAADQQEAVALLLARGADPNGVDPMAGETPLHLAILACSPEIVGLLLRHGADPDIATPQGITARRLARMYGQEMNRMVLDSESSLSPAGV